MRVKHDLARADADHLAAHAAQLREVGPRREAAAIDDHVRPPSEPLAILAKAHLGAEAAERVGERVHRGARVEMAFAGEEETFAEAPGEIRLERGDPRLVHPLMSARARGEAVDLADVARRRDDQRARRATPGTRASHQSIAPLPRSTTLAGALSPSQNGASMPPASHEALPPSSGDRSTSVTFAPRSASVSAVVRPTTPAPMTSDAAHRCRVSSGVEPQALLRPSQ